MSRADMRRRDFHKLSLAAFGGILAGTALAGCGSQGGNGNGGPAAGTPSGDGPDLAVMLKEPHVCRGLNTCKGLGRSGDNACAGLGTCASVADHMCGGNNECAGQGGCGDLPGANACAGQGKCAVPLRDHAWGKARKNFEMAMKAAGKEVGEAPAKS